MRIKLAQIHNILVKNKLTLAVAESCTGGRLSALLTQTSGSSQYFIFGIVAYHNKAKINILKIPATTIAKFGAVSEQTAKKMAQNARLIARTDFGIGITGIAGPTGATRTKPIGTVFIALAQKNRVLCKKFIFKGRRITVQNQAALKALELLEEAAGNL